jgi:anti-sigma regulatory factor (Ser/Thr protein kinase)
MPALSLTIPADAGTPTELRRQLDAWLQRLGADEGSRADIVLSAWEGCANAMEHAGSTEPIRVDAFATAGGVCVRIRDRGRWLDRGDVTRADRGHGLTIIRRLMSRVEIDRRDSGTSLLMCRSLERAA